ncbi:hypothetical protein LTR95_009193, partial [Oleoguttula sp. CCFEE 5521]
VSILRPRRRSRSNSNSKLSHNLRLAHHSSCNRGSSSILHIDPVRPASKANTHIPQINPARQVNKLNINNPRANTVSRVSTRSQIPAKARRTAQILTSISQAKCKV